MDLSRPDTRPWGPHPGVEPGPRGWSLDQEGSGGGAWARRALGVACQLRGTALVAPSGGVTGARPGPGSGDLSRVQLFPDP